MLPELRYSSQPQPQSHRFGFLDTELPVTLYRQLNPNHSPTVFPPSPVLVHLSFPLALVRHTHAFLVNAPLRV
jgi:hypothetical protein